MLFIQLQKSQEARRLTGRRSNQRARINTITSTTAAAIEEAPEVVETEITKTMINNNFEVAKPATTTIETNTSIYTMNYFGIDATDAFKLKYFLISWILNVRNLIASSIYLVSSE